jgi:hypothetical protein
VKRATFLGLLIALLALLGCSPDPGTGPVAVVWDRDTCERCNMALSDPHYAAQVRDAQGAVHLFDDVGCALLWIDEHAQSGEPVEIWVQHHQTGAWLDARATRYERVPHTPMEYGYGATTQGDFSFTQVRDRVREREATRRMPAAGVTR